MKSLTTKTIILNQGDAESKREEIRQYFHDTYTLDERLYDTLANDEAFYRRAEPLRHPLAFYFGHTAAFFVNKLMIARLIDQRINPGFESMFAIGVDEMSWDDLNQANYDWPTVPQMREFRNQVRQMVDDLITTLPLTMPITWDSPFWAIVMGIEHQRIHIETSSVIIRRLPIQDVTPLPEWTICPQTDAPPVNQLLPVAGGPVRLGKAKDHPLYGWDNEFGRYDADVWDFSASRYLVSNHEFKQFVDAGGYTDGQWWSEEGTNWLHYTQSRHPLFWICEGDQPKLRTMAAVIDMPWSWPVVVNQLEANLFTRHEI